MCFSCRCFAAFPHRWWETCQSWRSTRPRLGWPKPNTPALRRSCAKSEVSWCSFLWTSCPNTTSCLQLERRSPWSRPRSGREGREVLITNTHTRRRAWVSGQSPNVDEITYDYPSQTSNSAGHLKIAQQNHYSVKSFCLLVVGYVQGSIFCVPVLRKPVDFRESFSPLGVETFQTWKETSCLFKGPRIRRSRNLSKN